MSCSVSATIARICATSQPVHSAVRRRRSSSIVSASAPASTSNSWAYALRNTARLLISPWRRNGRLKASALDPAMIVLSRSKNAAVPEREGGGDGDVDDESVGSAPGTGRACQNPSRSRASHTAQMVHPEARVAAPQGLQLRCPACPDTGSARPPGAEPHDGPRQSPLAGAVPCARSARDAAAGDAAVGGDGGTSPHSLPDRSDRNPLPMDPSPPVVHINHRLSTAPLLVPPPAPPPPTLVLPLTRAEPRGGGCAEERHGATHQRGAPRADDGVRSRTARRHPAAGGRSRVRAPPGRRHRPGPGALATRPARAPGCRRRSPLWPRGPRPPRGGGRGGAGRALPGRVARRGRGGGRPRRLAARG